ncbi:MAG TPA: hypothetical protein VMU94_28320 [Streptosporangiaceae bacterium]|nr:hypothetical protein [Streptosporangiaceae bacterium]
MRRTWPTDSPGSAPDPASCGSSATLVGRDSAFLEYEIALLPDPEHDYGFGALIELGRL